jgi:hypothetical protein
MLSSTIPYMIVRSNSKVRKLKKMLESEGELPCHWRVLWMCWTSGGEERSVIGVRRGHVANIDDVPASWRKMVMWSLMARILRKNRVYLRKVSQKISFVNIPRLFLRNLPQFLLHLPTVFISDRTGRVIYGIFRTGQQRIQTSQAYHLSASRYAPIILID